jgi:hypothetical protein
VSALGYRNNYVEQPFLAPGYSNFERCRPAGQFLPALTAPTGHCRQLCWPSHGCHCLQPVISGCWPLNIKLQVLPLGLPEPPGRRCTVLPPAGLRRRSPAGTVSAAFNFGKFKFFSSQWRCGIIPTLRLKLDSLQVLRTWRVFDWLGDRDRRSPGSRSRWPHAAAGAAAGADRGTAGWPCTARPP